MVQDSGDPFAFLRSLAPAPGGDPADSVGGATPATEAELFAGSEPVPPLPAASVPSADSSAALATPAQNANGASAGTGSVGAGVQPVITGDVVAVMRAALVQLDARLQAIELIAKQNGWIF